VLAQEADEAARVVAPEAHVLVEVEGARAAERDAIALVQRDHLAIHRHHRGARREREHALGFSSHPLRDTAGREARSRIGVGFDHDTHTKSSPRRRHLRA
jgi:hypothetical protein